MLKMCNLVFLICGNYLAIIDVYFILFWIVCRSHNIYIVMRIMQHEYRYTCHDDICPVNNNNSYNIIVAHATSCKDLPPSPPPYL